jgi:hypothetical protein
MERDPVAQSAIRRDSISVSNLMMGGRWVAAALAGLALAGCGGGDESALTVQLAEENGSGQAGTATFTPAGEARTTIVVELSNPLQQPQPAHVHPGPCGDLGDPIAALESLLDGRSETTVSMSLEELQSGNLVVHAHESEAEFDVSVACALIPAR